MPRQRQCDEEAGFQVVHAVVAWTTAATRSCMRIILSPPYEWELITMSFRFEEAMLGLKDNDVNGI